MSFEVEIKFRTTDHAWLADWLVRHGATAGPWFDQEDVYLSHPGRDFSRTGEALRIRREGTSNRLTYKGPRRPGPTKTREEIEIGFSEGDSTLARMRTLWQHLGFQPIAVLRKRRQAFHVDYQGRGVEVVLDLAEELGTFAEIETIASGLDDLPDAQAAVTELAAAMGLTEVEPRSYLGMTLERRRALDGGSADRLDPVGPAT
jgi:adenylate cyclase class 2